jgi:hypothetical protein
VTATPPTVEPPPVTPPVIEPSVAPAAPRPTLEELTIKEDAVIGIRIDQTISSETASVEDRVTARISRDVTVDGRTAIPAGARLDGVVTEVERGGKVKARSRLVLRFSTLILADGLRLPIATDVIMREGASPAPDATAKIGASAVIGAVLGGVVGGKKGVLIGSGAGAGAGTAAVMAGGRQDVVIASGASMTLRLTAPVTITVAKDPEPPARIPPTPVR